MTDIELLERFNDIVAGLKIDPPLMSARQLYKLRDAARAQENWPEVARLHEELRRLGFED